MAGIKPTAQNDNLASFESDIRKQYQIRGNRALTTVGWTLYVSIMADLLMNARGSAGSLYAAMLCDWVTKDTERTTYIVIVLTQMVLLGAAACCLSLSPLQLWMQKILRDNWFAVWFPKPGGATGLHETSLSRLWSSRNSIVRDFALYALCVWLIYPICETLRMSVQLDPISCAFTVLAFAFFLAAVVAAVTTASSERSIGTGIGAGLGLALLVGGVMRVLSLDGVHFGPTRGTWAFRYAEVWIFGVAITGTFLSRLRSLDGDIYDVVVSKRHTWFSYRFFDATKKGDFVPVRFQIQPVGEAKLALLREPAGGGEFEICSLKKTYDLNSHLWYLLNLSELERRFKDKVTVDQVSSQGFLKMKALFAIEARTYESTFDSSNGLVGVLPTEFHRVIEQFGDGYQSTLSDLIMNEIRETVGQKLDTLLVPNPDAFAIDDLSGFKSYSLLSINSLLAGIKKSAGDAINTFASLHHDVLATSTKPEFDKSREFKQALGGIKNQIAIVWKEFSDKYVFVSKLDGNLSLIKTQLEKDLADPQQLLRSVVSKVKPSSTNVAHGLFELISLKLSGPVTLELTAEAKEAYREIEKIYNSVIEAHKEAIDKSDKITGDSKKSDNEILTDLGNSGSTGVKIVGQNISNKLGEGVGPSSSNYDQSEPGTLPAPRPRSIAAALGKG